MQLGSREKLVVFLSIFCLVLLSVLLSRGLSKPNVSPNVSPQQNVQSVASLPPLKLVSTPTKYYWSSHVNGNKPASDTVATYSERSDDYGISWVNAFDGLRVVKNLPSADGYTTLNWDVTGFDFSKDCILRVTYYRSGKSSAYVGVGGNGDFTSGPNSKNGGLVVLLHDNGNQYFTNNGVTAGYQTTMDTTKIQFQNCWICMEIHLQTFLNGRKLIVYHGNYGYVMNSLDISSWTPAGSTMCFGAQHFAANSVDFRIRHVQLQSMIDQQKGVYCWDASDGSPKSVTNVVTVSNTTNDAGYPKYMGQILGMQLTRSVINTVSQINWNLANFDFGNQDFRLTFTVNQSETNTSQGMSFGIGGSAPFSSAHNTANGGLCFRNQCSTKESSFYINGVQQGTFLPWQDYGNNANFLKRQILWVLEVRKYASGATQRIANVYFGMSGFLHNSLDITNWTPAGNYFFIGGQNGSASANAGVNYVRFCSLEYL